MLRRLSSPVTTEKNPSALSYHSLVAKIIFTNATPKSRHPCTASFARCCKNTFMDMSSVKMISGPPAPTTPPIALS